MKMPAELFPLGIYLQEELEERGWSTHRLAREIGKLSPGLSKTDIQLLQLDADLVIACSSDKRLYASDESLKAFATGLGCDWSLLANIQKAYREAIDEIFRSR